MASTTIISANAIKNNTGTVAYGGNVGSLMNSADFNELQANNANSNPNINTSLECSKAISNGTLAGMVATQFVGIGYDMKLANYTNVTDIIGSSDTQDRVSILVYASGQYQSAYVDWSYMSGVPTSVTTAIAYFDNDNLPTRTVPGRIVTLQTGSTPELDSYSSKNT